MNNWTSHLAIASKCVSSNGVCLSYPVKVKIMPQKIILRWPVVLLIGFASHHHLIITNSFSKVLSWLGVITTSNWIVIKLLFGWQYHLNGPLSTRPVLSCVCYNDWLCFCEELPDQVEQSTTVQRSQVVFFSFFFRPVKLFRAKAWDSRNFHTFNAFYCHTLSINLASWCYTFIMPGMK